jgi:DNA phosphorothioation system restriction enzyme
MDEAERPRPDPANRHLSARFPLRLRTLALPDACRSASHALAREVLADSLRESTRYDRAVGFFSSTVFSAAPEAFAEFFAREGSMRLVCSPVIGAADAAAIHRALAEPAKALVDLPRAAEHARRGEGARAFSSWLAADKISLQIAVTNRSGAGMYHEKIGLFTDSDGNRMAMSGSANESMTAWSLNFERVDLYSSWGSEDGQRRCWRIQQAFEDLWKNRTEGLEVRSVQEAFLEGQFQVRALSSFAEGDAPQGLRADGLHTPPEVLIPPPGLRLFAHQEEAVRRWAMQNGRGILALATGAGKTLTSLCIAARLSKKLDRMVLVVVAPFIHLVDQWLDNARSFGLRPLRAAEGRRGWEDELVTSINAVNAGRRPVLSVVTTQSTLISDRFQELISAIRAPILLIGDEVHNYGTAEAASRLPASAQFRVGLSATPERHRDHEGTARILAYFGSVAYRYGLQEAISDEVLTPYRYYPVLVELHADETDQYCALSKQLSRYIVHEDDEGSSELVMRLLLKRARLVASARGKLDRLRAILTARQGETHILVYCGDGQVEGPVPQEQQRQLDAAVALIGNELGMKCASYTATTPPDRRRHLLSLFASGQVQVLVAIRCLDEGVDVPSTRTAIILASSTNPRQFIQRRGRILRRAEGKSRADLYDLIVCPDIRSLPVDPAEFRAVQGMLRGEFKRVAEFASLALNGPVARRALAEITERMQLHDGWYTPPTKEKDRT